MFWFFSSEEIVKRIKQEKERNFIAAIDERITRSERGCLGQCSRKASPILVGAVVGAGLVGLAAGTKLIGILIAWTITSEIPVVGLMVGGGVMIGYATLFACGCSVLGGFCGGTLGDYCIARRTSRITRILDDRLSELKKIPGEIVSTRDKLKLRSVRRRVPLLDEDIAR